MCEPACITQLCSLEICLKPSECCKHNILLLHIPAQRTVNYGPNDVSVVGQIVFWVLVFFLTQDLTAFMVLWHLWPLVFLCHNPLPSDFCRSS